MASEFEVLKEFPKYEIEKVFPHRIRKISTGRVITVGTVSNGYLRVVLNRHNYQLHRLIALQFIPNDDPINKPFVDHVNRVKTDYRICNLRWASASENTKNKSSHCGVDYEILEYDEIDVHDLVVVDHYNSHEFEDLYYQPDQNRFLFDTGVNYRVMCCGEKSGSAFIRAKSTNEKYIDIFYNKFKKIYDLL